MKTTLIALLALLASSTAAAQATFQILNYVPVDGGGTFPASPLYYNQTCVELTLGGLAVASDGGFFVTLQPVDPLNPSSPIGPQVDAGPFTSPTDGGIQVCYLNTDGGTGAAWVSYTAGGSTWTGVTLSVVNSQVAIPGPTGPTGPQGPFALPDSGLTAASVTTPDLDAGSETIADCTEINGLGVMFCNGAELVQGPGGGLTLGPTDGGTVTSTNGVTSDWTGQQPGLLVTNPIGQTNVSPYYPAISIVDNDTAGKGYRFGYALSIYMDAGGSSEFLMLMDRNGNASISNSLDFTAGYSGLSEFIPGPLNSVVAISSDLSPTPSTYSSSLFITNSPGSPGHDLIHANKYDPDGGEQNPWLDRVLTLDAFGDLIFGIADGGEPGLYPDAGNTLTLVNGAGTRGTLQALNYVASDSANGFLTIGNFANACGNQFGICTSGGANMLVNVPSGGSYAAGFTTDGVAMLLCTSGEDCQAGVPIQLVNNATAWACTGANAGQVISDGGIPYYCDGGQWAPIALGSTGGGSGLPYWVTANTGTSPGTLTVDGGLDVAAGGDFYGNLYAAGLLQGAGGLLVSGGASNFIGAVNVWGNLFADGGLTVDGGNLAMNNGGEIVTNSGDLLLNPNSGAVTIGGATGTIKVAAAAWSYVSAYGGSFISPAGYGTNLFLSPLAFTENVGALDIYGTNALNLNCTESSSPTCTSSIADNGSGTVTIAAASGQAIQLNANASGEVYLGSDASTRLEVQAGVSNTVLSTASSPILLEPGSGLTEIGAGSTYALAIAGESSYGPEVYTTSGALLLGSHTDHLGVAIQSSAPTCPSGDIAACWGSGATCSVTSGSTDAAGSIVVTTATSTSSCAVNSRLLSIAFNTNYGAPPSAFVNVAGNTDAGSVPVFPVLLPTPLSSSININAAAAFTPNTKSQYTIDYVALGIGPSGS
ncbi:MAG TPA: hypothetical protein VMB50_20860 [Myxococcales bacterium]|nr:hypothetical protein [Myxococcales bacterium]